MKAAGLISAGEQVFTRKGWVTVKDVQRAARGNIYIRATNGTVWLTHPSTERHVRPAPLPSALPSERENNAGVAS